SAATLAALAVAIACEQERCSDLEPHPAAVASGRELCERHGATSLAGGARRRPGEDAVYDSGCNGRNGPTDPELARGAGRYCDPTRTPKEPALADENRIVGRGESMRPQ